jgi:hypothetical protein
MNNIVATAPGIIQPQVLPYPSGANSARTGAIATQNDSIRMQTSLIGTSGGSRRLNKKKKLKGGTTQIAVPTMQVLYPEPGAGNQTVNGNITATTSLGASSSANSVYDACIGQGSTCTTQIASKQMGGKTKKKRKIGKKKKNSNKKKSKKMKKRLYK